MAPKNKELGNYKYKIKKYFTDKTNIPWTKQGLNLFLNIDRSYVHDCRRRQQKWRKDFIIEYDKAIAKIETELLKGALVLPQYKWEYWKIAFPQNHEIDDKPNININIETIREIENE